jgi:hypothetical protein
MLPPEYTAALIDVAVLSIRGLRSAANRMSGVCSFCKGLIDADEHM